MSDCLFCKIIAGEIPSSKVYEDELCYAFHDIDPQAPMHFLVIPKAHIGSCGEITAENSAVVAHIFEVISKIAEEQSITDFRVVSNCGEQAGQSVHHLHFHVLAGRDMTWPPAERQNPRRCPSDSAGGFVFRSGTAALAAAFGTEILGACKGMAAVTAEGSGPFCRSGR